MVECGASFSADAAGEDVGSPASRAADDGKSHVDAWTGTGMPGQGASNGCPPDGRAGRKRIIGETESRNEVSPGYLAGGLRRKADCIRVLAPGRGRELLRAPGVAIGSAAGGRALGCGVPSDCAGGGGLSEEVCGGAGVGQVGAGGVFLLLSLGKIHQMVMFAMRKKSEFGWVCGRLATAMLLFALAASAAISAAAQTREKTEADHKIDHYYEPLPQETGAAGLKLMLRRLQTTARLMQVDAHPDDEDGGMLTLEARGKGVSTLLMTLNRGEGGQNKLGSNLFDVLGVVRTLEVLAADRYYGVEQRFSRVADFGYSKTPEETFQKWQGHDIALADIVRVVRTFRPDVLIARFSGTERDGHGHHQASAILTKEAFRAAADPNRFPEQIKEGLQPWQPKKLYIGNVCGFGASTCAAGNYTVKLNTGKEDPLLGMSYVQFAVEGLRHQRSQALGGVSIPKGDRFAYYKLVDSVVDSPKDSDGHEQDFFDGVDTTLLGLASRLGNEEKKVPWLREQLSRIQQRIAEVGHNADSDPAESAMALLSGRKAADDLLQRVRQSSLSDDAKQLLTSELETKRNQFQQAANVALGVKLTATYDAPPASSPESATMAVPGESIAVKSLGFTKSGIVVSAKLILDAPGCQQNAQGAKSADKLSVAEFDFRMTPCAKAGYTRPYWHRRDPERDALHTIDEPLYQTLPFPPPPFHVRMEYQYQGLAGSIEVPVMVRFKQSDGSEGEHPLAIGPEFSIALSPSNSVIPSDKRGSTSVKTTARDQSSGSEAQIVLNVPNGWRAEPAHESVISLVNTFLAMATDVETRRPRIANVTAGLSGPAIKPIALRMVYDAAHAVKIPVIGMGGIATAVDIVEFMLAGATAVQVGTASYFDPVATEKLVEELTGYCREHRIERIRELTGGLLTD